MRRGATSPPSSRWTRAVFNLRDSTGHAATKPLLLRGIDEDLVWGLPEKGPELVITIEVTQGFEHFERSSSELCDIFVTEPMIRNRIHSHPWVCGEYEHVVRVLARVLVGDVCCLCARAACLRHYEDYLRPRPPEPQEESPRTLHSVSGEFHIPDKDIEGEGEGGRERERGASERIRTIYTRVLACSAGTQVLAMNSHLVPRGPSGWLPRERSRAPACHYSRHRL